MSSKKIVIDIEPDGSVKIDAQGFKGGSCALATREMEMVLAGGIVGDANRKKKPDFFATNPGATTKQAN